jgi:hypothetical protein
MVESNKNLHLIEDLDDVFSRLNISEGPIMHLDNLLTEKSLQTSCYFEIGCTICR